MAKPRKKYNRNKLNQWASRTAEIGTMLIQAHGLGKDGKIWIFHDTPVPSGKWLAGERLTDYRLVFLTPHKWTVIAGVACRDQLGKNYFRYAHQTTNNELIYHDPQIQQWIYEFVAEQTMEVNKEQILSSFFIALPRQTELSKDSINRLLHWLNVFDPANIKTHYEMLQIKTAAEKEVESVSLEEYLPKQTACILKKHNIPDLLTLFWQEEEQLKTMKGIGKKRYGHIVDGLKSLAEKFPNFRELAWDNYRGEMCRDFILADAQNSEKFYQHYLETKRK